MTRASSIGVFLDFVSIVKGASLEVCKCICSLPAFPSKITQMQDSTINSQFMCLKKTLYHIVISHIHLTKIKDWVLLSGITQPRPALLHGAVSSGARGILHLVLLFQP